MTAEELLALKDRVSMAESLNERVTVAKAAIELVEKIDPEIFGSQLAAAMFQRDRYFLTASQKLTMSAVQKHAPAFIEAIKGQLKAHLEVQEKRLADA